MIKITGLSKKYPCQPYSLQDINLLLPRGEIIGLFGENGAGKTTLMKCILGFLFYDGEITLDDAPITRANIAKISFATSEHSFFPDLTPAAHKAFYADHFPLFSAKRFDALMDFFNLPRYKTVRHFSAGQKSQFEVILALCQGADYILLDEPFTGNDVFNREDFYKVLLGIMEPNETILLSTHLIEEISGLINRAILIRQGQIIGDTTIEALEDQGLTLISYIKETYHYQADRVSKALDALTETEE